MANAQALTDPGTTKALEASVEELRAFGVPAGMPPDARDGLEVLLGGVLDPNAPMEGTDGQDAQTFGDYLNSICGGTF